MNYSARSPRETPGTPPIAKRVVLVVVDGLRPDAIECFGLSNLGRIANRGASTLTAQSVSPCYTLSCVASLMTGVSPWEHGIENDRLSYPRSSNRLATLPSWIAGEGFQAAAFMGEVPSNLRGTAALDVAPTLLSALGLPIPRSYEGRVLTEAFETRMTRPVDPRVAGARYSLAVPGMINPQSVL